MFFFILKKLFLVCFEKLFLREFLCVRRPRATALLAPSFWSGHVPRCSQVSCPSCEREMEDFGKCIQCVKAPNPIRLIPSRKKLPPNSMILLISFTKTIVLFFDCRSTCSSTLVAILSLSVTVTTTTNWGSQPCHQPSTIYMFGRGTIYI